METTNTPPIIVSADDLLKRMRNGIKESYEIELRGTPVPVRVLSLDELTSIRKEAIKHQMITNGDETDRNVYIQKTVLKMASTVTKGTAPLLGDKILTLMTLEEISHLYGEYTKIMDDLNPAIENLRPEQFRALVDAVKKKSITASDCSLRQLRAIFTAYADLVAKPESQHSHQDSGHGG